MATVSQIMSSAAGGSIVTLISWGFFGTAVRFGGNSNLTPRAWSRPKEVLKNVLSAPYAFNWISWAIRLRYIDMLCGIPGTGTRLKGWSGPKLKANLDAVISLRFQSLQLKVSILTTILCMFMLLPLFVTTTCDPIELGLQSCINQQNLTDFEKTTIANVPALAFNPINSTTIVSINDTQTVILQPRQDPTTGWEWSVGLTGRYMSVVIAMALISYYSCYLLWFEWVECLALRRVYYLEADYYPERIAELDGLRSNIDPEDDFQAVRPPYLPHPEMRETIPNVSLNSVLYQLPQHLSTYSSMVDGHSSLTERQLAATVDFFDQCVPNQPGFTSSVVAVTIIPDASLVSGAWMKWYKCGKKLRRLRYIKQVLEERKRMEASGVKGLHDYMEAVAQVPVHVAKTTTHAMSELETVIRGSSNSDGLASCMRGPDNVVDSGGENEDPPQPAFSMSDAGNSDVEEGIKKVLSTADDEKDKEITTMRRSTIAAGDILEGNESSLGDLKAGGVSEEEILFEKEGRQSKNGWGRVFSNLFGMNEDNQSCVVHGESSESSGRLNIKASQRLSVGSEGDLENPSINVGEQDDPENLLIFQSARQSARGSIILDSQAEKSVASSTVTEPAVNKDPSVKIEGSRPSVADSRRRSSLHFDYREFDATEYAKWIGYNEETELDQLVDELGIEQLCVYAREMSQSASNPCVYGCGLKSLRLASIAELEDMVEEAWEAVRQANVELLQARADIFRKEGQLDADEIRAEILEDEEEKAVATLLAPVDEAIDEDEEGLGNDNVDENENENSSQILPNLSRLGEEGVPLTGSAKEAGLRHRGVKSTRAKYAIAQSLIKQMNAQDANSDEKKEKRSCCNGKAVFGVKKSAKKTSQKLARFLDHPSYAVVTFTSRQSAIAARQCLADGRGVNRWSQVDDIPTAPIADAPPRKPFFFRGCCRPVTLTINFKEKKVRKILVYCSYFFFCCLYTVPLALTSALLNPAYLQSLYPDSSILQEGTFFYQVLAGFSSGALYSLFFSVLPQVFKFMAFSEGVSSSVPVAEDSALSFYWYFMLVTAFTGSTLATMLLEALTTGELSTSLKDTLVQVARTIPTSQAPVWLNWIVVRTLYTLPVNYLCQAMTWLYGFIQIKWLNRVMRGGGPGGPPPYRIYVDAGVVFMCMTSLAPVAPLIAPFATLQYMVFIPILRWLNIFVYRPKYDGGGNKWPVLHNVLISALIWGQVLTGTQLLLKQAIVPGALVVVMTFPTFFFSQWTRELFLQSYHDAGLLQTSQLDGWEHTETQQDREKYRRWLVDCHKASYVPICLSGGEDFLTSQPAVVVPTYKDAENTNEGKAAVPQRGLNREDTWREISSRGGKQKGALWRRYLD